MNLILSACMSQQVFGVQQEVVKVLYIMYYILHLIWRISHIEHGQIVMEHTLDVLKIRLL